MVTDVNGKGEEEEGAFQQGKENACLSEVYNTTNRQNILYDPRHLHNINGE